MIELKANGVFHFSLLPITYKTYKTLAKHAWHVNAAWAALPNPLCQNCSTELLITPNAYMVGFCHFIRRQTCREVKRIHSGLTEAGFWVLLALFETLRFRKKIFFSLSVLSYPTPSLVQQVLQAAAHGGQPGEEGHSAAGRASWLLQPALPGWLMQVTQQ